MPLFAAILDYGDDAERRQQVRPTHREYLRGLLDAGKLHESGPLGDDSGAIIVYDVADISEAQEILANDPFSQQGVIVGAKLREWTIVMSKNGT